MDLHVHQTDCPLLHSPHNPHFLVCNVLRWFTWLQMHPQMARDLFPAGFVSCWGELSASMQAELVRSLEAALASPSIPADIVTALLNLAEFMEHNDKSLPLDTRYHVSPPKVAFKCLISLPIL